MKVLRKMILAAAAVILLLNTLPVAYAAEKVPVCQTRSGEVVFLLDASGSMNTQDKNRLAIDAIRQTAYSLPSNYRTGLVVYNTEIQAVKTLDAGMDQLESELHETERPAAGTV